MRKPDRVIGEKYLDRWHIIPRNRFFNIYLHKFTGSDDDRALHDHPWFSVSFLLKGFLGEIRFTHPDLGVKSQTNFRFIYNFIPYFRLPSTAHRMVLVSDEAWTLFITGPKVREWGFITHDGWIPWKQFVSGEKI